MVARWAGGGSQGPERLAEEVAGWCGVLRVGPGDGWPVEGEVERAANKRMDKMERQRKERIRRRHSHDHAHCSTAEHTQQSIEPKTGLKGSHW